MLHLPNEVVGSACSLGMQYFYSGAEAAPPMCGTNHINTTGEQLVELHGHQVSIVVWGKISPFDRPGNPY
jgi:hypothetical protein